MTALAFASLALLGTIAHAQTTLPGGWKIHPAGTQIGVGALPIAAALTPDGKYMLVLNAGANATTISVIDLAAAKELNRTPLPDAGLGLAMTKAGDKIYVGGGSRAAVFEFSFSNGVLTAGRTFPVVPERNRTPQDFVGDVRFAPDGHLLYIASVFRDTVVVMNPQSGLILSRIRTGRRPNRILFHPSGRTMYVSSWADGTIGQYDVNSGERLVNFRVAPHPADMLWVEGARPGGGDGQPDFKARMFVPGANTNSVFVLGASDTGDLTKIETTNLALTPRQPLGMTPDAVGLSADKKLIYVACSDVNALAVIDITGERNLVKGFVPTGAYPTAVVGLPEGRIAVLNGHGNSVELIDAPDDTKLNGYSDEVMANSPYRDGKLDPPAPPEGNPVHAGGPIKHVVYVVRGEDRGWLTAGMENDYLVRVGDRFAPNNSAPDPANVPPAGYLWNAAAQAGLKIRNYGFEVHNLAQPNADGEQIDRVYDPALAGSTDKEYRGPDPAYPDTERAKEFASELKEYDQLGEMPQLLLVQIGHDDQAVAAMMDAVTHSRFWNETAMFLVDADAPHVFVISRWTKVSNRNDLPYNPVSALRTIEIILGLRPMTIFDAAAEPMFDAFAITPTPAQ